MLTYVGRDLARLKAHSFELDGITFMGLQDLIRCKQTIGRQKDLEDIQLIKIFEQHGEVITPTKKQGSH